MKKSIQFLKTFNITASLLLPVLLISCGSPKKAKRTEAEESGNPTAWNTSISENASEMLEKGKAVFRYETFGDEVFWTDKLQLHRAIADVKAGGIGKGLTPKAALDAGLKVDLDVLPKFMKKKIKEGKLLDDTDATLALIKLNAVVGVVGNFALQFYQLAIPAPKPPKGSFNEVAAGRGKILFSNKAQCATCHVPPLFTEPGFNAHRPDEIGIDDFQASRSPENTYVTQGLKGMWIRKRGFYHDGRFNTLLDVVNHYNNFKTLGLSNAEKNDLVEYLKSL